MAKQELSLKQQYQRLTQAKAQATRNGQPTPKLDKKIEKMKAMMGSTVQKVPAAKPETKSQGLFHQIQKEVTFCGLPHGADA